MLECKSKGLNIFKYKQIVLFYIPFQPDNFERDLKWTSTHTSALLFEFDNEERNWTRKTSICQLSAKKVKLQRRKDAESESKTTRHNCQQKWRWKLFGHCLVLFWCEFDFSMSTKISTFISIFFHTINILSQNRFSMIYRIGMLRRYSTDWEYIGICLFKSALVDFSSINLNIIYNTREFSDSIQLRTCLFIPLIAVWGWSIWFEVIITCLLQVAWNVRFRIQLFLYGFN